MTLTERDSYLHVETVERVRRVVEQELPPGATLYAMRVCVTMTPHGGYPMRKDDMLRQDYSRFTPKEGAVAPLQALCEMYFLRDGALWRATLYDFDDFYPEEDIEDYVRPNVRHSIARAERATLVEWRTTL